MASLKKLGAAVVLAAVMAGGVSLEAAPKKKGGGEDAQTATCTYLWNVMSYPYVNSLILATATSLYTSYGCTAQ